MHILESTDYLSNPSLAVLVSYELAKPCTFSLFFGIRDLYVHSSADALPVQCQGGKTEGEVEKQKNGEQKKRW